MLPQFQRQPEKMPAAAVATIASPGGVFAVPPFTATVAIRDAARMAPTPKLGRKLSPVDSESFSGTNTLPPSMPWRAITCTIDSGALRTATKLQPTAEANTAPPAPPSTLHPSDQLASSKRSGDKRQLPKTPHESSSRKKYGSSPTASTRLDLNGTRKDPLKPVASTEGWQAAYAYNPRSRWRVAAGKTGILDTHAALAPCRAVAVDCIHPSRQTIPSARFHSELLYDDNGFESRGVSELRDGPRGHYNLQLTRLQLCGRMRTPPAAAVPGHARAPDGTACLCPWSPLPPAGREAGRSRGKERPRAICSVWLACRRMTMLLLTGCVAAPLTSPYSRRGALNTEPCHAIPGSPPSRGSRVISHWEGTGRTGLRHFGDRSGRRVAPPRRPLDRRGTARPFSCRTTCVSVMLRPSTSGGCQLPENMYASTAPQVPGDATGRAVQKTCPENPTPKANKYPDLPGHSPAVRTHLHALCPEGVLIPAKSALVRSREYGASGVNGAGA
eukprot:scaffold49_cov409-Prasinococcus_capsulatus_cf.AAC.6